jgi:hypothetical protein
MTVSSTEPRVTYAGNGSTTTFAIPFTFLTGSEVTAYLVTNSSNNAVLQTDPTEYSISGSNVEMVTAPAIGETLILQSSIAETQTTDYVANDVFPAETHEAALDKLTRLIKQIKVELDYNTIKLPPNIMTNTTIEDTDLAALKVLRVDAAGTGIEFATVAEITGGGDSWDDAVDSDIVPDSDSTRDIGAVSNRFSNLYADALYGALAEGAQTSITSVGSLTTLTVDNMTFNDSTITTSSGDLVLTPVTGIVDMSTNTDHVVLPRGTTAQRDVSSGAGSFRYNTTDNKAEYYTGSAWVQLESTGGPGSWANPVDVSITVDTDSTYDLGTTGARFANIYGDNLYGIVSDAAQTSITSVGTLTALDVDNLNLNGNTLSASSGDIVIGSSDVIDMSGNTGHVLMPSGTTAQRVGSTAGEMRYNSTTTKMEYYNGTSWATLSDSTSSGMVLISSTTISSDATVDLDNVFDTTYDSYLVVISSLVTATDDVTIHMRAGTGATPTYQTASNYAFSCHTLYNTSYTTESSTSATSISITDSTATWRMGNSTGECMGATIKVFGPSNSSRYTVFDTESSYLSTATGIVVTVKGASSYKSTTAVTSLRFYSSSGNITSGEIQVYGLSNS